MNPVVTPSPAPRVLPTFREDVEVVTEDRSGVAPRHVVRDPRTDRVFALEAEAYFLCSQLDGATTQDELLARYHQRFGDSLSPQRLEALIGQLEQHGLVEGGAPPRRTFPELLRGEELFPFHHVRLGSGDRFFGALSSRLGWLFTTAGTALMSGTLVLGISVLVRSPGRWADAIAPNASLLNASLLFVLLVLASALLVMDPVRQLAHGVMAKRYGCQVHDVTISFAFYLIPLLSVDWSEALLLREKPRRLRVILAGIWAQVFFWALAMIAWWLSAPGGIWNFLCLALSVGALFALALRSANPLVENDAGLLLATWLEIPRMRARALAAFGDRLHGHPPREAGSHRERRWLTFYGALCTVYVVGIYALVCNKVGSRIAVDGTGAAAMLVLGMFFFQRPLRCYFEELRVVRWFHRQAPRTRRRLRRLGVLGLAVLLALVPYPYETGGPFVLLPLTRTEVPVQVEGQIKEVLVTEGQLVAADQPLAHLDRWPYELQLQATREQLGARKAELRLLEAGPRPEEIARNQSAVEMAQAEVARAAQQVKTAEARLEYSAARAQRYHKLYREDAVSRQEYENAERSRVVEMEQLGVARAQLEVSEKALDVARAELRVLESGARAEQVEALEAEVKRLETVVAGLEEQLRLTVVRSSVPGRVITPYVDQKAGKFLRKGELFAVVEEATTIQAEVQLPEEDAGDVEPAARVKVVTWAYPNTTFYGRVLFVAPVASLDKQAARWRAVRVLTEIPNQDGLLKPAMTGYAKIAASWRPLGQVLLWPPLRWVLVQVWYWLP